MQRIMPRPRARGRRPVNRRRLHPLGSRDGEGSDPAWRGGPTGDPRAAGAAARGRGGAAGPHAAADQRLGAVLGQGHRRGDGAAAGGADRAAAGVAGARLRLRLRGAGADAGGALAGRGGGADRQGRAGGRDLRAQHRGGRADERARVAEPGLPRRAAGPVRPHRLEPAGAGRQRGARRDPARGVGATGAVGVAGGGDGERPASLCPTAVRGGVRELPQGAPGAAAPYALSRKVCAARTASAASRRPTRGSRASAGSAPYRVPPRRPGRAAGPGPRANRHRAPSAPIGRP